MSELLTSSNKSVFRRFLPSAAYRSLGSIIGTIHRSDFLQTIGLPRGFASCSPTASCAESVGSHLFRQCIYSLRSNGSSTSDGSWTPRHFAVQDIVCGCHKSIDTIVYYISRLNSRPRAVLRLRLAVELPLPTQG